MWPYLVVATGRRHLDGSTASTSSTRGRGVPPPGSTRGFSTRPPLSTHSVGRAHGPRAARRRTLLKILRPPTRRLVHAARAFPGRMPQRRSTPCPRITEFRGHDSRPPRPVVAGGATNAPDGRRRITTEAQRRHVQDPAPPCDTRPSRHADGASAPRQPPRSHHDAAVLVSPNSTTSICRAHRSALTTAGDGAVAEHVGPPPARRCRSVGPSSSPVPARRPARPVGTTAAGCPDEAAWRCAGAPLRGPHQRHDTGLDVSPAPGSGCRSAGTTPPHQHKRTSDVIIDAPACTTGEPGTAIPAGGDLRGHAGMPRRAALLWRRTPRSLGRRARPRRRGGDGTAAFPSSVTSPVLARHQPPITTLDDPATARHVHPITTPSGPAPRTTIPF